MTSADQTVQREISTTTPPSSLGKIWDLVRNVILQARILKRIYPGLMHLLLFWGVTLQIIGTVINLLQYPLFVPFTITFPQEGAYLAFELTMDLAGGMIFLGIFMAVIRRLILRPQSLPNRWDDWYVLGILTVITLFGFISEGFRLLTVQPEWRTWSPIGSLFATSLASMGFINNENVTTHLFFFWGHFVTGLIFLGSLPFTKLRHLLIGPLNIFFKTDRHAAALETIQDIENVEKLGVGTIDEYQPRALLSIEACVQCGRCEDVCPAFLSGMSLSPRKLMQDLDSVFQTTLVGGKNNGNEPLMGSDIAPEDPWSCTTCGACVDVCPMFIHHVDCIVELRRYQTLTTGDIPSTAAEALTQMERYGNPWGLPPETRGSWLQEIGVRILSPGDQVDVLLYLGCAYAFDARNQQAGHRLVRFLKSTGVEFGVLANGEMCCGETARRLGHEYLFQVMAEENIATLQTIDFQTLVTPCAHCYNTLKNEYPEFGEEIPVQHHTEYLSEIMEIQSIRASSNGTEKTFTFHDSCYLGRYNQLLIQPRRVLEEIEGLAQHEMPRRMEEGFCCGGGGGQMWMETDPNTRISHRRLEEAVERAEADVIVTACPYCMIMFEDAVGSKNLSETTQIQDIVEVLVEHSLDNEPDPEM